MANVFDSFVKAYDQTANTNDRIKRGQYADYADRLRLNNTFSNDEVTRNYNRLISDQYKQLSPTVVSAALQQQEIRGLEQPARVAVAGGIANAVVANPQPYIDARVFSAKTDASVAKANAALAENSRLFTQNNPDAAMGPAYRALNYAKDQAELLALSGNDPDALARTFGGTRDDYVRTPQGWTTKDGIPVLSSADRRVRQGYQSVDDFMRSRMVSAGVGAPVDSGPFSAAMRPPFESALLPPPAPVVSSSAVPNRFSDRYPAGPISDVPQLTPQYLPPATTAPYADAAIQPTSPSSQGNTEAETAYQQSTAAKKEVDTITKDLRNMTSLAGRRNFTDEQRANAQAALRKAEAEYERLARLAQGSAYFGAAALSPARTPALSRDYTTTNK